VGRVFARDFESQTFSEEILREEGVQGDCGVIFVWLRLGVVRNVQRAGGILRRELTRERGTESGERSRERQRRKKEEKK
jgi:hypothetical protein